MSSIDVTKEHSWYDKRTHILRSDGRVVRATLKELVITGDTVLVKAAFTDGGVVKQKHVDLPTIAALQVCWMNIDVVSDVEIPEDDGVSTNFDVPLECERLPCISIHRKLLTAAVQSVLHATNFFIGLHTQSPGINDLVGMTTRSKKTRTKTRTRTRTRHRDE